MKKSYKKLSDNFFSCFIGFVVAFLFFSFLGNFCLFNFNISGFIVFRFLRSISFITSVIFILLSIIFSYLSSCKKEKIIKEINELYMSNNLKLLTFFKKYFILKIKKEEEESSDDMSYFLYDFKDFIDCYTKRINSLLEELEKENCMIEFKNFFPDYIEKISTAILEDYLYVDEFIDIKHSENSYLYEDKINYIYSENNEVYLFKDLFISKLNEEHLNIVDFLSKKGA